VGSPGPDNEAGNAFIQSGQAKAKEIKSRKGFDDKKDKIKMMYFAVDDDAKKDLKKQGIKDDEIITKDTEVLDFLKMERKCPDDLIQEFHYFGHSWTGTLSLAMQGELPIEQQEGQRNEDIHLRATDISKQDWEAMKKSFTKDAEVHLYGCMVGKERRNIKENPPAEEFPGIMAKNLGVTVYGAAPGTGTDFKHKYNKKTKKNEVIGMHGDPDFKKDWAYWKKQGYEFNADNYMKYNKK
jgi:hypothetical protein